MKRRELTKDEEPDLMGIMRVLFEATLPPDMPYLGREDQWQLFLLRNDLKEETPKEEEREGKVEESPKDAAIKLLMELWQLKQHKDAVGKSDFYKEQQPIVWEKVKAFFASSPTT